MSNEQSYKLTAQDKKILSNYELHLKRATQGYTLGLQSSQITQLEAIYEKFGYRLHSRSCGGCILTMLKILAEKYGIEK